MTPSTQPRFGMARTQTSFCKLADSAQMLTPVKTVWFWAMRLQCEVIWRLSVITITTLDAFGGQTDGHAPEPLPYQGMIDPGLSAPAADARSHQQTAPHLGLSSRGLPPGYRIPRVPPALQAVGLSGSESEGSDEDETGPFSSSHLSAGQCQSGRVSKVTGNARRPGTQSAYNSPWGKWVGWCGPRKISPFPASVADITNFLADMIENGMEYSTINVYRSALSAYHPEIQGHKVGQHPLVVQFMKGAFYMNPPKPRYSTTCSVDKVLNHI